MSRSLTGRAAVIGHALHLAARELVALLTFLALEQATIRPCLHTTGNASRSPVAEIGAGDRKDRQERKEGNEEDLRRHHDVHCLICICA